jgi:hypothetical protein
MKKSLYNFYSSIYQLLNQIKCAKDIKKKETILTDFLEIPNFIIYKSRDTARILNREEIDQVRTNKEDIIRLF